MTTLVSTTTAWTIVAGATLAALVLAWVEWRRPDRQHRAARVAASLLAVGALAVLGVRPTSRVPTSPLQKVAAALWTPGGTGSVNSTDTDPTERFPPGEDAARSAVPGERRFALPGASDAPPGVVPVPDAAFLRRQFPEVGTLHVFGGGLEPWDLAALRGVRLIFHRSAAPGSPTAVRFLRVPREVPLGGRFAVQGQVGSLPTGGKATLTLLGPGGAAEGDVTVVAGADGTAAFALAGPPTRAAGGFAWRLRLQAGGEEREEELGVAVVPPELPRVLVLESAPRFDTAALRRWLAEAGGAVTTRTVVGQDRRRFASANGAPGEFTALDGALLARFDVVLADARALASLAPVEDAALRAGVTDDGLGVLVLGEGARGEKERGPDTAFFQPWEVEKVGGDDGDAARAVRPTWAGQARSPAGNVLAEPFAIRAPGGTAALPGARTLVRDGQGRALAAGGRRGRGQVALTLVRETRRWRQSGEPEAFAAYWSFLLAEVARRRGEAPGRWGLAGGAESGPTFVHQPLELRWTGPGIPAPGVVETAEAGGEATTLPLAQDPAEPARWRGTFWPRRAGWHRVRTATAADAPGLSFYVHGADAWPGLRAERRRAGTARAAALAPSDAPPTEDRNRRGRPEPLPPGWAFAVFFVSAAYLWAERRFARVVVTG